VKKLTEGWSQVQVADFLGVHAVTVARWMAQRRHHGDAGLAAKPTPGRPQFLSREQEQIVLGWLADKPTAHGFRTDLWTARRVADLVRKRFDVSFHPDYLRAWLRKRGCSPQKPRRRAKQRNDQVINQWVVDDWPRIQKKRPRRMPISF